MTSDKHVAETADATDASAVTALRSGAVAVVTMRTPALTAAAKQQLLTALDELSADGSIRAVVLTGAGRVFCAGQDLGEHAAALERDPEHAFDTVERDYNPIVTSLVTAPKPVIAAINGTCAGAGLSLALACDLRVCADSAKFTTAFTGIGLSCDSGLSATLAQAVGLARASELVLRAEPFTAERALSWGLVGEVVAADELADAARALAERLAAGPTLAHATAKAALRRAWGLPLPEVLAAEGRDQHRLGLTVDHRNATAAFLAKQRPQFHGR
ncbi:enoyl-CoA hydratase/isomerase family protein [Dactylosporangium sp. CA-092794]|uniref:enoyl-CoA hydratase/isomerase family protein n=1 Tax=Dactylosporangium sp. CA-092794 TaxID=3239929 RepID=UPI003D915FAE